MKIALQAGIAKDFDANKHKQLKDLFSQVPNRAQEFIDGAPKTLPQVPQDATVSEKTHSWTTKNGDRQEVITTSIWEDAQGKQHQLDMSDAGGFVYSIFDNEELLSKMDGGLNGNNQVTYLSYEEYGQDGSVQQFFRNYQGEYIEYDETTADGYDVMYRDSDDDGKLTSVDDVFITKEDENGNMVEFAANASDSNFNCIQDDGVSTRVLKFNNSNQEIYSDHAINGEFEYASSYTYYDNGNMKEENQKNADGTTIITKYNQENTGRTKYFDKIKSLFGLKFLNIFGSTGSDGTIDFEVNEYKDKNGFWVEE